MSEPMTPPRQDVVPGLAFFLEKLQTGKPVAAICPTMNFALTAADLGFTEFTGHPDATFSNPGGVIHGGYLITVLSSAMSCAVHTTLAEGERYTTTDIVTQLVRPLQESDGPIVATGRLIHRGRRGATAEGRLVNAAGKLIAHGTTTCVIFLAS